MPWATCPSRMIPTSSTYVYVSPYALLLQKSITLETLMASMTRSQMRTSVINPQRHVGPNRSQWTTDRTRPSTRWNGAGDCRSFDDRRQNGPAGAACKSKRTSRLLIYRRYFGHCMDKKLLPNSYRSIFEKKDRYFRMNSTPQHPKSRKG